MVSHFSPQVKHSPTLSGIEVVTKLEKILRVRFYSTV